MLPQRALPEPWDESDSLDADGGETVDRWEDQRAERSVRAVRGAEPSLEPSLGSDTFMRLSPGARWTTRDRSRRADAWEPPRTLRQRIERAVSVPYLAGAVVFVVAISVALGLVWFQPHSPPGGAAAGAEIAALAEPDGQKGEGLGTQVGAAAGEDSGSADSAEGSSTAARTVFVHVVGAVAAPGVVELPANSRVRDAVAGAGGATGDAVLAGVNLARPVVDGEQILVPDAAAIAAGVAAGAAGNAVPPGPATPGMSPNGAAPVDLNTADLGALESLPRVGPALAQRILDWRATNGDFSSVDQLLEVPGIGAKTLEGFRDRVRVS